MLHNLYFRFPNPRQQCMSEKDHDNYKYKAKSQLTSEQIVSPFHCSLVVKEETHSLLHELAFRFIAATQVVLAFQTPALLMRIEYKNDLRVKSEKGSVGYMKQEQ